MCSQIRCRYIIGVYRNDKLVRSFEKINSEPLKIRWENETANKYFMWNENKYYFYNFERIHENINICEEEKMLFPPDIIMRSKWNASAEKPELYIQNLDGAYINLYIMT